MRGSFFLRFPSEKGQPCPPQAANKADITLLKLSDFLMMITSNVYLLCMLWKLLNYTHFCGTHIGQGLVKSLTVKQREQEEELYREQDEGLKTYLSIVTTL